MEIRAKMIRRLPLLALAVSWGVLSPACDNSPGAAKAKTTSVEKKGEYPQITAVSLARYVFDYDEAVPPDNFSVTYQESESESEITLAADEILIDGAEGAAKAGSGPGGVSGLYGEQTLKIAVKAAPRAVAEAKIYVTSSTVSADKINDLQKLEVVQMPSQKYYDKGEPFNRAGLETVAWYGGDSLETGGVPFYATGKTVFDDTDLLASTLQTGKSVMIGLTYTDQNSNTAKAQVEVQFLISQHQLIMPKVTGGKVKAAQTTVYTGQAVTLTVENQSGYKLNESSLSLVQQVKDKASNRWVDNGTVSGLAEIAPSGGNKRYLFTMPRYQVKVEAQFEQDGGALSNLQYGIEGGTPATFPGFNPQTSSSHLTYQLAVDADAGTDGKPLVIKAFPQLEDGGSADIQITKGSDTTVLQQKTVSNGGDSIDITIPDINAGVAELATGVNEYRIQILYSKGETTLPARTYTISVLKPDVDGANLAWTFAYNGVNGQDGSYQTFLPPKAGKYRIEAWGAAGGNAVGEGGKQTAGGAGGYVKGEIASDSLVNTEKVALPLYIYAGGQGGRNSQYTPGSGGWNGGGNGGESGSFGGAGGGGATSVSLVAGNWDNLLVLANRIMVAGGGGGAAAYGRGGGVHSGATKAPEVEGGLGGGVAGSAARTVKDRLYGAYTAYTNADEVWTFNDSDGAIPGQGEPGAGDPTAYVNGHSFGIGAYGRPSDMPDSNAGNGYNGKGGAGGGWWGGRISLYRGDAKGNDAAAAGGGGSSFIAGHAECRAVALAFMELDNNYVPKLNISFLPNSAYQGRGTGGPGVIKDESGSGNYEGSPQTGPITFTGTEMNTHNGDDRKTQSGEQSTKWEPDPAQYAGGKGNTGHGKVVITYLGAN